MTNMINHLSQRDPRWSLIKLGASNMTLGAEGCTTTDISMLSEYFNCYQSPAQIAENPKNYLGATGDIIWINLNFPNFSFRYRLTGRNDAIIKYYVKDPNKAVILEVDNGIHWVLPFNTDKYGDYDAIDPWNGGTCKVLAEYHNITGMALFQRWQSVQNGGKQAWQGKVAPVAPLYA